MQIPPVEKRFKRLEAAENNIAEDEKRIHALELVSHGQSEAILALQKPKKKPTPKPKPKVTPKVKKKRKR